MRKKTSSVRGYLKEFLFGSASPSSGTPATREENLTLYRNSRSARSPECPNLPLNLLVEVSSRCNLECRMCNIHHDTRSGLIIPEKLLDPTFELAKTATAVNPFGLGEPLLHPEITGIVGRYKSLGVSVILVTNGMLLHEGISRGFILNKLDHLTISIDSADPALFATIRRGADLTKISDNIRKLNDLKKSLGSSTPELSLHVVVQDGNFHQLRDIVYLAEKLNIFFIAFAPITVHGHIAEIQGEALGPWIEDWEETLETCEREAEARGIGLDMHRLSKVLSGASAQEVYKGMIPCPEPFRFMVIRANGDIFPCCNWDVKKPIEKLIVSDETTVSDLVKIWNSPQWQALREKIISENYPEECRICMGNFTRPVED